MGDAQAFALALVENVQRADLTPVEEAGAYRVLADGGTTQEQIGTLVGKSQSYVAHKLQLLRLPAPLAHFVQEGALTENHVRQITPLRAIYPAGLMRHVCETDKVTHLRSTLDQDQDSFWIWINAWRPEEWPPHWVMGPLPLVIQEGTLQFADYVAQHTGTLPQWEVAAYWWAALAIRHAWSVADLGHEIRMWRQRWEHALTWWAFLSRQGEFRSTGHPPTAYERETLRIRWGFWADLRHSGTLAFANQLATAGVGDKWRRFPRLALVAQEQSESGYLLPSTMQRWPG